LRQHRQAILVGIVLALAAALLAWFGVRYVALLREGSLLLDDLRLANFAPRRGQSADIILLAINEDTLAEFPFRSPINRRLIAGVLDELAARDVRAVGIDVIFDQPTNADDDQALLAAFDAFPRPLIVAVGSAANGLTERQLAFQERYLVGRERGLAGMLITNGVVRHLYPGEQTAAGFEPGLAVALAEALGAPPARDAQQLYYRVDDGDVAAIRSYPVQLLSLLPRAWFKDVIVLIGADLPNQDTFRTPLSAKGGAMMTGAKIHAQALAQLLDGARFPGVGWRSDVLILAFAALLGVILPFVRTRLVSKAALGVLVVVVYWFIGLAGFARGGPLLPLLAPTLGLLLASSFGTVYARRRDQVEKRFVRAAFARYVSPSVIEEMLENPSRLALGGEKREMSFVFSDLEGFTSLSERLPPDVVVALLQEYLDGMIKIAFASGATVDRLVGDGIAVFFGAPTVQRDHAPRAVGCALAWDRYGENFRQAQRRKGIAVGITRIGVHTGSAVVGNVGSAARFHYTAHGDCVNTAARLEGANKYLGTRMCLSRQVAEGHTAGSFLPVGTLLLKGKANDLECVTDAEVIPVQWRGAYLAAFAALALDRDSAERQFAAIGEALPDCGLVALHLRRLRRGEQGVRVVLDEK